MEGNGTASNGDGGGIAVLGASAVIRHNSIVNNVASRTPMWAGAAAACWS